MVSMAPLDDAEYTASTAENVETDQTARLSALVVEDEANIRELVCLHLGLEHINCTQAAAGDIGLKLARERHFDLVILDLMLPGLDGVTVCRAIRRDTKNADVPILMLTARRDEADKVVGLGATELVRMEMPQGQIAVLTDHEDAPFGIWAGEVDE